MKNIVLLCFLFLFAIDAKSQYYDVEINNTDSNPKDCGKVICTAEKIYYYWPKSTSISSYDWVIDYADNGRPKKVGNAFPSKNIDTVPGWQYVVSFDDRTLVVKGEDNKLHVYDWLSKTKTKVLELGDIGDFEINSDGSWLAVSRKGQVDLIDIHTEKVIRTIPVKAEYLEFSPGNQFLVVLRTHEVEIFNLWAAQSIKLEDFGFVRGCEMSVNGRILVPHVSKDILSYDAFDMVSGKKLRKTIKGGDKGDWYYYSIHPRGEVFQIQGDFYTMKSKKYFDANSSGGLKFHPFLPGVFVSDLRKGKIGTYYFKD